MNTKLKDALRVRANTGLPDSFVQDDIIICPGEDRDELLQAMRTVLPGKRPRVHEYKCFHAWKYEGITVVLTGIGTGCVEPLLYELLDPENLGDKVAKRLVLIGTAGYLSDTGFGQVYLVEGAYPVGCGVLLEDEMLPVRPNFDGLDRVKLARAEELSTSYYYSCTTRTDNERINRARAADPALRAALKKYWRTGRLISMETAQFYHLARIYGQADTQYAALRGVTNTADDFASQCELSLQVLTEAFRQAVKLLSE